MKTRQGKKLPGLLEYLQKRLGSCRGKGPEYEFWKPILHYPDYEVSTHGRVRRVTSASGTFAGRVLRQHVWNKHVYVRLALGHSVTKKWYVHRLVVEAFVGLIPCGCEVHHIDADGTNNHVSNLQIVTRSENVQYAQDTGLMHRFPCGLAHPRGKLSVKDKSDIKALSQSGVPTRNLSEMFDITPGHIRKVVRGDA